jgi:hypothetical protein
MTFMGSLPPVTSSIRNSPYFWLAKGNTMQKVPIQSRKREAILVSALVGKASWKREHLSLVRVH